jgi:NAD-dependent SIR2 family protein deacetylase
VLDLIRSKDRFVAFVGAGASAIAPSSLPTWSQFNSLLLEALCDKLAAFSGNRQPTNEMLETFRWRRDKTQFFSPDFQAQLMEEEIGGDYFAVWQSIDSDVYGPVHAGLAELAAQGRLAAIVTTNFDRLIEKALTARKKRFQVFHDVPGFERLEETLESGAKMRLPVIKIHGSIEDAASLVDTLRQRIVGRPQPLLGALRQLLEGYPWLFLGFSGADFSYNRHYLGILDAASTAKGFVFVARPGSKIEDGVTRLAEAFGAEKSSVVIGELASWLSDTFSFAITPPAAASKSRPRLEPTTVVRERLAEWTGRLGNMAVVNIVCSLLRSAGLDQEALWLLRKTWKSYRSSDDTTGASYDRYNYNFGMSLLDVGFIRNPIALADDQSNVIEWRRYADQNAFEYLSRGFKGGRLRVAGAHLASLLAYRGEVGSAIQLATDVTDAVLADGNGLERCDVALAHTIIYDVVQVFAPAAAELRQALSAAERLGDECRRAMLCVQLARFLTYARSFAEAEKYLDEADRIGERLDLRPVLLTNRGVRGLWLADSGWSVTEGIQVLRDVVDTIHAMDAVPLFTRIDVGQPDLPADVVKGRHPIICRALLDLNRAAMLAADSDIMNTTLDELDTVVTDVFLGYCPHYYLAYAQCLLSYGDEAQRGLATDLLRRARELGEKSGNPWAIQVADQLSSHLSPARSAPPVG